MSRSSLRAALLATVALAAAAAPVCAQLDTSKPIRIKEVKPKVVKFQGEVLNSNSAQITVRSRENQLAIHTFTYSPKAREQMQRIIERGGYQYGDKVEIQHEAGSDVALQVKGKPSKPL